MREAGREPIRLAPAAEEESDIGAGSRRLDNAATAKRGGREFNRGGYTIHTTLDPKLQAAARHAVRENLDEYLKRQHREPPYVAKHKPEWGPPANGHPKRFHIYVGKVPEVDDRRGR